MPRVTDMFDMGFVRLWVADLMQNNSPSVAMVPSVTPTSSSPGALLWTSPVPHCYPGTCQVGGGCECLG